MRSDNPSSTAALAGGGSGHQTVKVAPAAAQAATAAQAAAAAQATVAAPALAAVSTTTAGTVQSTARTVLRQLARPQLRGAGPTRRAAARLPLAAGLLAVTIIGLELRTPLYLEDPGVAAAIETAVTITALLGAYWLFRIFDVRRRVGDLLLVVALVSASLVDFAFVALPGLDGVDSLAGAAGAALACGLVVSLSIGAAALIPARARLGGGNRPVLLALLVAVACLASAGLAASLTGARWVPHTVSHLNFPGALGYPVSLAVRALSGLILIASSIAFVVRSDPRDRSSGLLGAAALLLAGSMLQYLAMPALAADWVTPATGMRLAAYGLLLVVALRRDARLRQVREWEAVSAERQRIARDLHDGLAQDLAVIAAHGPHLMAELGPEHPLVVAAQRSLAASRGAIIDLAASAAPTTAAALEEVAEELEGRFRAEINVRVRTSGRAGNDLDRVEREQVVRIAREAIVNAARHGGARRIDVEVDYDGPDLLRVTDDGCGIDPGVVGSSDGFGLPTMRARAEAIGCRLVVRPAAHGGTELQVLTP